MGIIIGILCFGLALLVLCYFGLVIIDKLNAIPTTRRIIYDTIEDILRNGFYVASITIVMAIAAFIVFLGIMAILYLH